MRRKKIIKYLILIFLIFIVFVSVSNYEIHKHYREESLGNLCNEWQSYPDQRVNISKILVDRKDLLGIDKNKVIKLLGDPSKEMEEDFSIIYGCRKDGLIFSYTLLLNIKFDQNNKVIDLHTTIIDD